MSKSFTQFKRMSLEEKLKSILNDWKKAIVVIMSILILTTIFSCITYNVGESMMVDEHYSFTLHKDVVDIMPVKKFIFILYTSILGLSLYVGAMFLSFNGYYDNCKNWKSKLYVTAYNILPFSLLTLGALITLYYLGGYISPLIFE